MAMPSRGQWVVAILCAAVAAASMACSTSPAEGELYLTVIGDGHVSTTRTGNAPPCPDGGCNDNPGDSGNTVTLEYPAGTEVDLAAQPAPGWHFTSWQIMIEQTGQPSSGSTSTAQSIAIFDTGNRMTVVATFSP
jgi:hypothetical protein